MSQIIAKESRRHYRRVGITILLLALVGGAAFKFSRARSAAHTPAVPLPALKGEAARQYLQEQGLYTSLAAAFQAAQYKAHPLSAPDSFELVNRANAMRASFGVGRAGAARIVPLDAKRQRELLIKLAGYGYGTRLVDLTPGELAAHENRVEYSHYPPSAGNSAKGLQSAIRNPQSAIKEWFVNQPEGLEHGFTLPEPPLVERVGAVPLRVQLELGGAWRPRLDAAAQAVTLTAGRGAGALSYSQLRVSDACGRELAAHFELAGRALAIVVEDAAALYPLTIDPMLSQQQRLTATDGSKQDFFGTAVALSGNTALIGARNKTVNMNSGQGAAYIFVRNGTSWSQQAELKGADSSAGDFFGSTVALSGDTALIGAGLASINGHANQGAAYVFVRNGTTWSQQQKIVDNNGAAGDTFGGAVALEGDTALIGAFGKTVNTNSRQGAAYVFVRSATTWTQQATLTANDGASGDGLGYSVALSGDTALVGAVDKTIGANVQQGAAYVFVRNGTSWAQQQQLTASDGAGRDEFGFSVALSGDTALVGAWIKPIGGNSGQGAAYLFVRSGTSWSQLQQLTASDGATGNEFGYSVALSGDTALVGALAAGQGAAYVFVHSGIFWSQLSRLTSNDGVVGDSFGGAVALSGDTALIGAPGKTIGTNVQQGAAYVFVICGDLVQQQQLTAGDGAGNDRFGTSVALSGDTALVGARFKSFASLSSVGAAYVFVRNGNTWTQQQELTASDGAAGDEFGDSVALDGNTALIGAPDKTIGANTNQGAAYVFVRSGTTWSQQQELTAGSDGAKNDVFGSSVALSGDTALVAAQNKKIGTNDFQGVAYVFTRGGTTWSQQQRLTASDGTARDFFGSSVALAGNTALVGADGKKIGTNDSQGAAYVFVRSSTTWSQQQRLTASDGTANDSFGQSVALRGDTALIGAPQKSVVGNTSQGVAYVFGRNGTTWNQQREFTASDATTGDNFSFSVALDGNTALVGAIFKGAAYVFTRIGATWSQQQKITPSDGAANDQFGISVALSGGTALVGAGNKDIGANSGQGAAYVFVCAGCPTITLSPGSLSPGVVGTSYSQTITASGDPGPFQFSLSDNSLPPGLTLTSDGVLSGTPTTAGTYTFTLTATVQRSFCPGSRSYTVTIVPAGSCFFSLSATSQSFAATPSGPGSVSVTAPSGCSWTVANNNPEFITVTSSPTGSGNGAVSYTVASHTNTTSRSGSLTIGGQIFMVFQGAQFLDVPPGAPFYDFIGKLSARGITGGCDQQGDFCPGAAVNRAQMAVFLERAMHGAAFLPPQVTCTNNHIPAFNDVACDFFGNFIEQFFQDGITGGCGANPPFSPPVYCPASGVTRAAMAVFILRAEHGRDYRPPAAACVNGHVADFTDVGCDFFGDFIEELFQEHITGGCAGTAVYCPAAVVTRGQMAVFLVRAFGL